MTPQEKAIELVNKFRKVGIAAVEEVQKHSATKSALLCVRELIQELAYGKTNSVSIEQEADYHTRLLFWNEVEKHLK